MFCKMQRKIHYTTYFLLNLFFLILGGHICMAQWNNVNTGTTEDLYSVDYYSPNDIWIGSFNQILTTGNNGSSWVIRPIKDDAGQNFPAANMYDIALTSSTNAIGTGFFLFGNAEYILTTTNTGDNWNLTYNNPTSGSIRMVDLSSQRAVAVGANGRIAVSNNAGSSWTFTNSGINTLITDVKFASHDTVYAASGNKILRSVDGGVNWTIKSFASSFQNISCDHGTIYAGGYNSLMKSKDNGLTYTDIPVPFEYAGVIYALNKDTLLAAGKDGLYVSRSGGQYWEKYILPSSFHEVKMIDFYNLENGIAVGEKGYVIRTTNLSKTPRVPLSLFSIINNTSTYCLGETITFTNTSVPGCTYKWLMNGTVFSTAYIPPSLKLNTEGDVTLSLIVSNSYGSDTSSVSLNVIGHTIKPITYALSQDTTCSGNMGGFILTNTQKDIIYYLKKGNTFVSGPITSTGGTLYFSTSEPVTIATNYSIEARKITQCFSDTLIFPLKTIYVYTGTTSPQQICTPLNQTCNYTDFPQGITQVNFGSIVNVSSNRLFSNYTDYSCCKNTDVVMGDTYPLFINTAAANGVFTKVWIDFNADGIFDENTENVVSDYSAPSQTKNIKIGNTTVFNKKVRMRISADDLYTKSCSRGCGETEDYSITILPAHVPPVSSFDVKETVTCTTKMDFTNTAYNAISYTWDFGDGSPTVTTFNATHEYPNPGTYIISLKTCNPYGCHTSTQTKTVVIPDVPAPVCIPDIQDRPSDHMEIAYFAFDSLMYNFPTNPKKYNDFTCTKQVHVNASSTYNLVLSGQYNGYLSMWIDYNNDGKLAQNEMIENGYHFNPGTPVPLFIPTDAVQNKPLRMRLLAYGFDYNPKFIYEGCNNGSTIYTAQADDYTIFIGPLIPVIVNFNAFPANTCLGEYVHFENKTQNATTYFWDFGDGTTDSTRYPSHLYKVPGTYTVSLKAFNAKFKDSLTRTALVVISPTIPTPVITLSGNVLSTPTVAQSYQWYRNDSLINGANSSMFTPLISAVYKLVISNGTSCSASSAPFSYFPLKADFAAASTTGCGVTTIKFTDLSKNNTQNTFNWGDGTSDVYSKGAVPTHTYKPGIYTVSLFACNGSNKCDTLIRPALITIFNTISAPVLTKKDTIIYAHSKGGVSFEWYRDGNFGTPLTFFDSVYKNNRDGYYNVLAVSKDGCKSALSDTLYYFPLHVNFINTPVAVCGDSSANVTLYNYTLNATTYLWNFGDGSYSTDFNPPLHLYKEGTYTITLKACSDTICDSIVRKNYVHVDPKPFEVKITPALTLLCPGSAVDVILTTPDVPTYKYTWYYFGNPVDNTNTYRATKFGRYELDVENAYGCFTYAIGEVNEDNFCVWPGDANNDGLVYNTDLLPIGLNYGKKGIARATVSYDFNGNHVEDWNIPQDNGFDMKHVDCNGDGTIDYNDTIAVNLNFRKEKPGFVFQNIPKPTDDASIYFETDKNSYKPGEWVNARLMMGKANAPVTDLYGLSFFIQFDGSKVEDESLSLKYTSSWLNTPSNKALTFSKNDPSTGSFLGAIIGTDHSNRSGYGKIADFRFKIRKDVVDFDNMFLVANAYAVDIAAKPMVVVSDAFEIPIDPVITTVDEALIKNKISVYPNPYQDHVNITYTLNKKSEVRIEVLNTLGQHLETIAETDQSAGKYTFDFNLKAKGYEAGVYLLKIMIDEHISVNRIIGL